MATRADSDARQGTNDGAQRGMPPDRRGARGAGNGQPRDDLIRGDQDRFAELQRSHYAADFVVRTTELQRSAPITAGLR